MRVSRGLTLLLRLCFVAVAIYAAALAALVLFQRRMMYFPAGPTGPASAWGFTDAQTLDLAPRSGEKVVAWYQPARPGKLLFVYFHGNGGTLGSRAAFLHALSADGSGFVAIDYAGYGGSTGHPSERALIADGRVALAFALQKARETDIVILGESLGTAVAIATAVEQPVHAVILDSPFSSAADIAAATYWMFPVHLVMADPFDSLSQIGRVTAPKLFIAGTGDPITPIRFARKLFTHAPEPKTFMTIDNSGHMQLRHAAVLARAKLWLGQLAGPGDKR